MDHTVVLQLAEVGCALESAEGQPGLESGAVSTCLLLRRFADCLMNELLMPVPIQHTFIEELECKVPV